MTLNFNSLGVSEERANHLEKNGLTAPTQIQSQAIPQLLAGRDVVGQSQTGTGKTAAFSLPILERIDVERTEVQALILTPTRELAVQVSQAIRDFNIDRHLWILPVYGGQAIERQTRRLKQGVHIVVGTPGRIIDLMERGELKLNAVSWLVLDEADEMLSMGFIDDVEKILKQVPTERQTAFFSATMPPVIRELVAKFLRSPVTVSVEQPKAAPKQINQVAYTVPRGWSKARALQPILELEDPESAIIFVRTRRAAWCDPAPAAGLAGQWLQSRRHLPQFLERHQRPVSRVQRRIGQPESRAHGRRLVRARCRRRALGLRSWRAELLFR